VAIFVELSITERTALLKLLAKALNQLAIVAAEPPIPLDERRNRRRTGGGDGHHQSVDQ
jgi:hypothetical protein